MPRVLSIFAAIVLLATAHAGDAKPNILFIFADDWGRYASAYAALDKQPSINHIVKTPNIDRVAREGVLFKNAFVNAPSCTPCRSSLLSGRYFFNTGRGAILIGATWDSAIPSYPLLLRDGGYHIGETYKVWSPGSPNDGPFGAGKYAFDKSGQLPNNYSENVTQMVKDGMTLDAAREKILEQVRGNFDAFLAARPAGQPWHYYFGTTTTHRTWIKGSGKALWSIDPGTLEGKLPKFLPDVPEMREDVADYLGEVQALDAYVGVILKRLEESGEYDKTIIVLSGDHGMPGFPGGKCNLYDFGTAVPLVARVPGGKGGRVVDDFVSLPDLTPTFLEAAGIALPAGLNSRSLWPVLTSEKSGQVDPARTWVIAGRERHVDSAQEDGKPYPMRSLRTADFLYIRNFAPERWPMGSPGELSGDATPPAEELESNTFVGYADMDAGPAKAWLIQHRNDAQWKWHIDYAFAKRPAEELYDLRKDPEQMKNIAGDAAYAEEKNRLAERLLKILRDAGDPRVVDDGKVFENPPYTDIDKSRAEKKKKK